MEPSTPIFGILLFSFAIIFAIGNASGKQSRHPLKPQVSRSLRQQSPQGDFVFLTFRNGTDDEAYDVNLVTGRGPNDAAPSLSSKLGSLSEQFVEQYPVMEQSDPQGGPQTPEDKLTLWAATTRPLSRDNGTIAYQVSDGGTNGLLVHTLPLFPAIAGGNASGDGGGDYALRVCVFGDFSENLYEHTPNMDVSQLIQDAQCNLNLFIGKIAWERRRQPSASFNFSPFVMLYSHAQPQKHAAFARVPSIFGATGGNLTETTFFHSTEVGDVAFLQITVEITTVADLPDGTLQYEMIAQYFRETMLNELECKLQELHRRSKRPWIVLYMTHPYLVTNDEDQVQWFLMNDTDRFFDILKRYKVDLLTSCGIEGMSRILAQKHAETPEAKLPAYIQTTMAQCGGYLSMDVTLQNECSYAVLDIRPERMRFRKMDADSGNALANGQIERTFEKADQCVPPEEDNFAIDE